jgi:hypothetical protein
LLFPAFEQEAARSGAQCTEDVLVELERGQDEDASACCIDTTIAP